MNSSAASTVSLHQQLWNAFSWKTAGAIFSQATILIRSIFMARLLTPEDYGLWGMASVTMAGIFVFTHCNLGMAFITRTFTTEDERTTYLNTIWTADLVRRGIVSLLLLSAANLAGQYFGDQRVRLMLLIVGTTPFILGFENIGVWQLHKDLSFKRLALQLQGTELVISVASVIIAYYTRSFWALVCCHWMEAVFLVIGSYVICRFRPRFQFNAEAFRHSIGYGKHMLVIGLLTFITTQFDNLVIGRYLGPAALGAYTLAYRLACLPAEIGNTLFNSVLFPFYAQLSSQQDASDTTTITFVRTANITTICVVAMLGNLYFAATAIIRLIYGSRWDAAIPYLSVLVFVGLFRSLASTISPFLQAISRPGLDATAKVVEAAVFIPLVLVLVKRFSGMGAAFAGVIAYGVGYALRFRFVVGHNRSVSVAYALLRPLWIGLASGITTTVVGLGLGFQGFLAALCFSVLFFSATLAVDSYLRQQLCNLLARSARLSLSGRPGKSTDC